MENPEKPSRSTAALLATLKALFFSDSRRLLVKGIGFLLVKPVTGRVDGAGFAGLTGVVRG